MSQIPSLQTLRAFAAAGRLQSYSKAAEELGLTHGAVSHRIRELEERLGKQLFRRVGNTMVLTLAGQELEVRVRQGLSLLEQAFAAPAPKAGKASRPLVISAVPSLAQTWLVARLGEFRTERPDLDIAVRMTEDLADFKKDGVDIAVRLGRGGWPGLHAHKLFDEALTPVCTATYRDKLKLKRPEDLARATLLRNPWTPWARWFKASGLNWAEPTTGPMFDDSTLMLRAVMQGDGVALARHWLAVDDLRAGRLVTLYDVAVDDDFSYWLVWPTRGQQHPEAEGFRAWLADRAASEEHPCPLPELRIVS